MAKLHWEDREKLVAGLRGQGMWAHVCFFLGTIFAILGIIAGAMNSAVGLAPTYWFLLAIVAALLGIPFFMGVALSWYLREKK